MIQIGRKLSKFTVVENGEELIKTWNLKLISQFLSEEKPADVEDHLLTGNTLHFDEIEHEDQETITGFLREYFYKEHSHYMDSDD